MERDAGEDGQLQQQIREGEEKSAQLVIKNEEIAAMKVSYHNVMAHTSISLPPEILVDLRSEVEGLEAKLREEKQCKDAEIRRLTEELRGVKLIQLKE